MQKEWSLILMMLLAPARGLASHCEGNYLIVSDRTRKLVRAPVSAVMVVVCERGNDWQDCGKRATRTARRIERREV